MRLNYMRIVLRLYRADVILPGLVALEQVQFASTSFVFCKCGRLPTNDCQLPPAHIPRQVETYLFKILQELSYPRFPPFFSLPFIS